MRQKDGLLSRQQPPYGEFLAERCLLISPAVAADKGDLLSGWGHIDGCPDMMRRNLTLAFAGCALALAGSCVSPEELRREDEARCAGYGFQTGTFDFANCLQRENLARLVCSAAARTVLGILGILERLFATALLPSPPSPSDGSWRSAT